MFAAFSALVQSGRLPHGIIWMDAASAELDAALQFLICQGRALDEAEACGTCKSCQLFASPAGHPDVLRLQPEGKMQLLKIDQVRAVVDFLSQSAQQGGYKVVVFEAAESLNLPAQNALLKSLEEPGRKTILILVTTRPDLLLPTIKSRCQVLQDSTLQAHEEEISTEFMDAFCLDFDPLKVAAQFKDSALGPLFDTWYEFIYQLLCLQQQVPIRPKWHSFRVALEAKAKLPSQALLAFLDDLCAAKALLDKKVALNQQALLERLLIKWFALDRAQN